MKSFRGLVYDRALDRVFRLLGALFVVMLPLTSVAETLVYCVVAQSTEPGQELLQSRVATVDAPADIRTETLESLVSEVLGRRLWSGAGVTVNAAPLTATGCGLEDGDRISLKLTLDGLTLDVVDAELNTRSAGAPTPRINAIARQSQVKVVQGPIGVTEAGVLQWIRVYYATNRVSTGATTPQEAFGDRDSGQLRVGHADVSIPRNHKLGKLESPLIWKLERDPDPRRHVALARSLTPLSKDAWVKELKSRSHAPGTPGVLVFVHGYNSEFVDALRRAAQLAHDIAFPGPTVLFSWPSSARLLAYARDETEAQESAVHMARLIQDVMGAVAGGPVYLIGHSMGNRVLLNGLARARPGINSKVNEVVLAAPDIGVREFRRFVDDGLLQLGRRFTLYAAEGDKAVSLSSWLHGDTRLGVGGDRIAVFPRVDSIDATGISNDFFSLNHSFFGDQRVMVSDLFALIRNGLSPDTRAGLERKLSESKAYWRFRE